tara:strand:+ start:1100 stop:1249 length:150 start_codon:yes stop_codon:yes gene_type:complete
MIFIFLSSVFNVCLNVKTKIKKNKDIIIIYIAYEILKDELLVFSLGYSQ